MIITIDGPAGSGKSTVSRQLAERIGFHYLDTGAMYRAVAWNCRHEQIDAADLQHVAAVAERIVIQFQDSRVLANDHDVTSAIRSPEITADASLVAANHKVRTAMVKLQRQAADGLDIVSEGRDQGTVVFPDADFKFFLTASIESRALRRQQELESDGRHVSFNETLEQLRIRDQRDESRAIGPMKPAENAITIDTSEMTAEEVLVTLRTRIDR